MQEKIELAGKKDDVTEFSQLLQAECAKWNRQAKVIGGETIKYEIKEVLRVIYSRG